MSQLARALAITLLVGTALLGASAVVHPMLSGDAPAQLQLIARTSWWRPLHLVMLAGSGLVIAGVWVRLLLDRWEVVAPFIVPLAIITVGLGINALNIAFMAGSGWHMANEADAGTAQMSVLFGATHLIGLMAARFGNFLVALGALALWWLERTAASPFRLAAPLALVAGVGGLIGVLFFDEASRATLAAVALLSGWQVVTAASVLRAR